MQSIDTADLAANLAANPVANSVANSAADFAANPAADLAAAVSELTIRAEFEQSLFASDPITDESVNRMVNVVMRELNSPDTNTDLVEFLTDQHMEDLVCNKDHRLFCKYFQALFERLTERYRNLERICAMASKDQDEKTRQEKESPNESYAHASYDEDSAYEESIKLYDELRLCRDAMDTLYYQFWYKTPQLTDAEKNILCDCVLQYCSVGLLSEAQMIMKKGGLECALMKHTPDIFARYPDLVAAPRCTADLVAAPRR